MSSALYYDPKSLPVANGVTQFIESVDLPPTDENSLSNPDLSQVKGIDQKYWKVFKGQVVPMTQDEMDQVDATIQAELDQQKAQQVAIFDDALATLDTAKVAATKTDVLIDQIQDLNGMKTFIKRLCRYVVDQGQGI